MRIIGGLLVKNEADRWLSEFLASFKILCDEIIVLDDCSTDNTVEICSIYSDKVYLCHKSYWENEEFKVREKLFELCLNEASINDWIIILDADELINEPLALKEFMKNVPIECNGFGLKLYDMWDDEHYRSDEYWTAHKRIWQMATRKKDIEYTFRKSKLHCGRLPLLEDKIIYNEKFYIKHMGWSTEKDRQFKYDRYIKCDPKGVYGWLDQYKSILDKNPNLIKLEENVK